MGADFFATKRVRGEIPADAECMWLMATQAAGQIHKVLSGKKLDWAVN